MCILHDKKLKTIFKDTNNKIRRPQKLYKLKILEIKKIKKQRRNCMNLSLCSTAENKMNLVWPRNLDKYHWYSRFKLNLKIPHLSPSPS